MNTFLLRAFTELDQAGVAYCLMRDAYQLDRLAGGGEIDLLVKNDQLANFDRTFQKLGCIWLPTKGYEPHRFYVYYDTPSNGWFKFDVITEVGFGLSAEYIPTDLADHCVGNRRPLGPTYAPSAEDELVTLLLHCVLDKKQFAPHRREWLRVLRQEVTNCEYLSGLLTTYWLPNTTWDQLASQIDAENWDELLAQRAAVETRLAGRKHAAAGIRQLVKRARRLQSRLRAFVVPAIPTVALLGPDGAGKSTLASGIGEQFCLPVDQVYMGLYQKRSQPSPKLLPGLGFARLIIVQWKRYMRARYRQARGHLVIFDRYPYDALLPSPKRMNWPKRARRWLLAHACPPPNLVMVLDAPGDVLHARKGEHTSALLEEQRQSYRALQTRLPNVSLIDATCDAEDVRRQVNSLIWQALKSHPNGKVR